MTRIHFWLTASLLALALPSAQALDIKPVDNIVAVVNDDVITRQELDLVTAQMRSQLPKGQNINTADLQQQALAQLILRSVTGLRKPVWTALAKASLAAKRLARNFIGWLADGHSSASIRDSIFSATSFLWI